MVKMIEYPDCGDPMGSIRDDIYWISTANMSNLSQNARIVNMQILVEVTLILNELENK